jgi:hypothetical protein
LIETTTTRVAAVVGFFERALNAGNYIQEHIEKSLNSIQGVAVPPDWQHFISHLDIVTK